MFEDEIGRTANRGAEHVRRGRRVMAVMLVGVPMADVDRHRRWSQKSSLASRSEACEGEAGAQSHVREEAEEPRG